MELFSFGMDPILEYLEKRFKDILIHSVERQCPVNFPNIPPARYDPPPALPGLPALPPPPAPPPAARRGQAQLQVFHPLETSYILYAYCDDLKPAITSVWEFVLVERVMTLFEKAFGCKMHRTAESQKCKFLALGKWKNTLTQQMIPHDFFTLSDHLDFLGVTLKSTFTSTRKSNGDILQDRVKKVIGPWKGGRFMCLNLRSHSTNTYAFSKLLYRCNVIDLCIEDINVFKSTVKSFIYIDLLEKPSDTTLYRDIKDGGLGFLHIQYRAKAALLSSFLQTAVNPNYSQNSYHNVLYRYYVQDEILPPPKIPPNFSRDFFPILRKLSAEIGSLDMVDLKTIYNFLMMDILRTKTPANNNPQHDPASDRPRIPLRCELATPETDWPRS